MKLDLESIKNLRRRNDKQKSIPLGETIFIDLTPPSHKKLVDLRHLKKKWRYGLFCVAAFCIASSIVAVGMNAQSEADLASETSSQRTITQNTAAYAEVNQALELQKIAVESLKLAAGSEIDWNKLITSIEGSLPSGTKISAISVTGGGKKPASSSDPDVSAVISLNLSSSTTLGYSDSLRSIENMPGIKSVEISGLKSENERYTYTLSFTYDTSLLTGRFIPKDKE